MIYGGHFDIDAKKEEVKSLESLASQSGFWDDIENANKVNKKISNLTKEVNQINDYVNQINNINEMLSLADIDDSMLSELNIELNNVIKLIDEFSFKALLSGKYDSYNCILEIHPGAGGTEACDWASMLLRMYQRYALKKGYIFEIIDELKGEEAGIKSVTVAISGEYAYGYLKSEIGVHRLIRISPFDSNSRRHTSFASVSIIPEIESNNEIEINPNDLKIDVFHSGGAGGQSVNTTDSAVRITHLPTKIVVSCQNERSQIKNKEQAMKILISKLSMLKELEEQEKLAKIKGESLKIDFGSQIRTYTLEPFKLIKDNRTKYETSNVEDFLDGNIDEAIEEYLKLEVSK